MNKYEIMFIVNPTLEEASIKNVATEAKNAITTNGGKILEEKDLGQKDLAYEIKKHKKGYYFLFVVNGNKEVVNAFNHISNVNENIIRSLVVKVEE